MLNGSLPTERALRQSVYTHLSLATNCEYINGDNEDFWKLAMEAMNRTIHD